MEEQNVKKTNIAGVFVINRPIFEDERGFFHEIFRYSEVLETTGLKFDVKQANHSRSVKGVIRGIHVASWAKMVTALYGEVRAVIVDLREDSTTFGEYFSVDINDKNRCVVLIPPGCGNAFQVLSESADYLYFVDEEWVAGKEYEVSWADPDIGIVWEDLNTVVSERDKNQKKLREVFPDKFK